MTEKEQAQLLKLHHIIVDSTMGIVASLYLTEILKRNGSMVFIHNNVTLNLDANLIVIGLNMNLKDYLIEDYGESDGLNRTYGCLRSMYTESEGKPTEISESGREFINGFLIALLDDYKQLDNAQLH